MGKSKRRAKNAKELERRAPFRAEPDRVLIVTEGSKTEPAYFRMLSSELGLSTVRVVPCKDSSSTPINVVEWAEKTLERDNDFEWIYCVFDHDSHPSYEQALEKAKEFRSKTIRTITSVPCFELWYLLHVSDSGRSYVGPGSPCDALIADLKKNKPFKNYDKKDCSAFFKDISKSRDRASKRAKRLLKQAKKDGIPEFHENPSTRVHEVVEALTNIAGHMKSKPSHKS